MVLNAAGGDLTAVSSAQVHLTGGTGVDVTATAGNIVHRAVADSGSITLTADSDVSLVALCAASTSAAGCSKIVLDPQSSHGFVEVTSNVIKGTSASGMKLQANDGTSGTQAIVLDALGGSVTILGDLTVQGSLGSSGSVTCSTTAPALEIQASDTSGAGFTISSNPSNGGKIKLNPQSNEVLIDGNLLKFAAACDASVGMTIKTTSETAGSCSSTSAYMDLILDPAGEEVILTHGKIESGYTAATGSDVALQLTGTTSATLRAKSGALTLTASGDAALSAGAGVLTLTAGTAATIDAKSGALTLTASGDASLSAGAGSLILTAGTLATIDAKNGALTLTASGSASLSAGAGSLTLTAGTSATIDANGGALALTGSTNVVIKAESGTFSLSAATSAHLTATNGDLVLASVANGKKIKLSTQGTANAVEVTRGLLTSGSGTQLALSGASGVAVHASSGALGMTAAASATLRATSGTLTLTASGSASLSAGSGSLTLTAGTSATIDANGGALALTGSTNVAIKAESGSLALTAGTSATIEANGGALQLTGSTNVAIKAEAGSVNIQSAGGSDKITLTTQSTSRAIEITQGLVESGSGVALQLTGLTAVGISATNGDATIKASNGAIVLHGKVELPVNAGLSIAATPVIASGTQQSDATAFTAGVSSITLSNTGANQGVLLPVATVGMTITILRATTANIMLVYPTGSATINGASASAAYSLSTATNVRHKSVITELCTRARHPRYCAHHRLLAPLTNSFASSTPLHPLPRS